MSHYANLVTAARDDWYGIERFDEVPKSIQSKLFKHYPSPNDLASELTLGDPYSMDIYLTNIDTNDPAMAFGSDGAIPVHRIWYFKTNNVELAGFRLATHLQRKGTGRKVLWATAQAFKRLGVGYLTMESDGIGSYVWARAGFQVPDDFDPRWQMERMLKVFQSMREYRELETEVVNEIEDLIINNPDDLTKIADYPLYHNNKKLTKQILIETDGFPCELNLNDRKQMRRLKDYTSGKIP